MLRKGTLSFYEWCINNEKKEYLEQWDYELNDVDPHDISYSKNDYYYFKCENGLHDSYLYSIRSITVKNSHGPHCPVCGSLYQWCLDNNRQDIIDAWDTDKNEEDIRLVPKSSGKRAWFTFEYYSYYYPIGYISNISKNKNGSDPVKKYHNSLGYYIVDTYGPEYIEKFWSDKNTVSPFEIDRGSRNDIWLKCIKKDYHEDYKTKCHIFTNTLNTCCPMCSSKKIHPLDSFAQYSINKYGDDWLERCWLPDNTIDPYKLSANNSSTKVHLRCMDVEYHDFWITPANYNRGYNVCHYCNIKGTGGKVHPLDSFGAKHPEFVEIWSDKNVKSPYEYSEFSHDFVWLKCENGIHDDYRKRVADISRYPERLCPKCSNVSSYEKATRKYLESLPYTIKYENECTLYPVNPRTNYKMPYDNEIVELKLIIEVMGRQHYRVDGFHYLTAKHNGTTPEEEFEYLKWKDEYKKQYALDNGYRYLAIPYYEYSDSTYITTIQNKINEIINLESVETAGFDEKSSD